MANNEETPNNIVAKLIKIISGTMIALSIIVGLIMLIIYGAHGMFLIIILATIGSVFVSLLCFAIGGIYEVLEEINSKLK